MEERFQAPRDVLPAEPQDALPDVSGPEDELSGAIPKGQATVWMYPICRRIDAAGAALGLGAIFGAPLAAWFGSMWGTTALLWTVFGSATFAVYLYSAFRAGWVDVSADRLKVQDTLASQGQTFMRGEVGSVELRDGRMSISGGDAFPRWRRLRPRQERKLREQLERYRWIEPGGV